MMQSSAAIVQSLFTEFNDIRYVAIYENGTLNSEQKHQEANSSSSDTDRYEELLVNPALLTLARQRGNIDCGGLRFLIVGYGNFYQLVKETDEGHISICLDLEADLVHLPDAIFNYIKTEGLLKFSPL